MIGHETSALTAQLPYTRHLLFYPHIARINIYCDGEAVITNRLSSPFFFFFFTSQHTLRNNEETDLYLEETAEACILNIFTLPFVDFKPSFFSSSLPSYTSSHPCHVASRFKSLESVSHILSSSLLLLTHPPPPFSCPPLSSHPPAISYLPQGEAGESTVALGSQEHS